MHRHHPSLCKKQNCKTSQISRIRSACYQGSLTHIEFVRLWCSFLGEGALVAPEPSPGSVLKQRSNRWMHHADDTLTHMLSRKNNTTQNKKQVPFWFTPYAYLHRLPLSSLTHLSRLLVFLPNPISAWNMWMTTLLLITMAVLFFSNFFHTVSDNTAMARFVWSFWNLVSMKTDIW